MMLSLVEWQPVEHFKTIVPKLTVIHVSPLSADEHWISSTEMDSTFIYVRVRSAIRADVYGRIWIGGRPEDWEKLWARCKDTIKWESLGGEVLGDAWPDAVQTKGELL